MQMMGLDASLRVILRLNRMQLAFLTSLDTKIHKHTHELQHLWTSAHITMTILASSSLRDIRALGIITGAPRRLNSTKQHDATWQIGRPEVPCNSNVPKGKSAIEERRWRVKQYKSHTFHMHSKNQTISQLSIETSTPWVSSTSSSWAEKDCNE